MQYSALNTNTLVQRCSNILYWYTCSFAFSLTANQLLLNLKHNVYAVCFLCHIA